MTKLSDSSKTGLQVIAKHDGATRIGRINSMSEGTVHFKTIDLLVDLGLASCRSTSKGDTLKLTAKGKKLAATL